MNAQSTGGDAALLRWGFVSDQQLYSGRWWGLVSNAFVHFEPFHILFNMYWLWFFGRAFERTLGPLRLILFVLITAFVTSGIQLPFGSGIGFSGVGYALFGFGWATRTRYPEMARIATPKTVQLFVIWAVICIVATQFKLMNIANGAHVSGAIVGYLIGLAVSRGWIQVAALAGIFFLSAAAVVPIYYNPWSEEWLANQAMSYLQRKQFARALPYLKQYEKIGYDKAWAWSQIAYVENELGHESEMMKAIEQYNRYRPGDPAPSAAEKDKSGD